MNQDRMISTHYFLQKQFIVLNSATDHQRSLCGKTGCGNNFHTHFRCRLALVPLPFHVQLWIHPCNEILSTRLISKLYLGDNSRTYIPACGDCNENHAAGVSHNYTTDSRICDVQDRLQECEPCSKVLVHNNILQSHYILSLMHEQLHKFSSGS